MRKYAIWNKQDPILTPIGEVLTPEQWIQRYPIAGIATIIPIVAAGEINGAYFGTLGAMVQRAEAEGCDFSACTTDEEKLFTIEAFEDEQNASAMAAAKEASEIEASNAELTATSLASIAASMEYQNMLTLDDVEEV